MHDLDWKQILSMTEDELIEHLRVNSPSDYIKYLETHGLSEDSDHPKEGDTDNDM